MCRLLGVSKQASYKHDDKLLHRLALESFVVDYVKEVRRKDPGIGGGKLWKMYNRRFGTAWHVGFNRFYAILERHGLKLRRRKRRAVTTDSRHGLPVYPNLVKELIPNDRMLDGPVNGGIRLLLPFAHNRLLHKGNCGL